MSHLNGAPSARQPTLRAPSTLAQAFDWIPHDPAVRESGCHTAMGRIVLTPDGRPIRSPITGRKRHVTGCYPSRKARRAMPHESMNELALFQLSEVDTNVVDYRAQPCRFEFVVDGVARVYIADCARLLLCGTVEIVEAKADWRALRDPDYARKLTAVDQLCRRVGWRFRIATKADLVTPPAWRRNVLEVQSRRMTSYGEADCHTALDLFGRHPAPVPLGKLTEALAPMHRGRGMAMAMAMMVGRVVEIELEHPLTADTPVRCVAKANSREIR